MKLSLIRFLNLLFLFTLLISNSAILYSQVPRGFNYQAIARDPSGDILSDCELIVLLALVDKAVDGNVIWEEAHRTTTDKFGLFVLQFGDPDAERVEGKVDFFTEIDWTNLPLFLRTRIDFHGINDLGTSQLFSVPYSMVSADINGPVDKLQVTGKTTNNEEALFEVKNNADQTIFAVYNEGVRIFVDDLDKGAKGGFAVSGFGTAKAPAQQYFLVTGGSTQVFVDDNQMKGAKGGFSVSGFNNAKELTPSFLQLSRENYFIGHQTGQSITTGTSNLFLGYQSGIATTTGMRNIFIGELSGRENLYGENNVFLGYNAGLKNIGTTYSDQGDHNVYIGTNSGKESTLGVANTFVGAYSGENATSGVCNTFLGTSAGQSSLNASDNTFIGYRAGQGNTSGNRNVCIGLNAGEGLNSGTNNILVGVEAGRNILYATNNILIGLTAGRYIRESDNVIIGHNAGASLQYSTGNIMIGSGAGSNYSGHNRLYIENSNAAAPLIGGDFAANRVGINRIPTTYTLEVGGTIWANGTAITAGSTTWSDVRYKSDIETITGALELVSMMRGVRYNWKETSFPDLNFPEGKQIGVIAQEVEAVVPELVVTGSDGYKSVSYEKIAPILIEAVKEQQKQIDVQNMEIRSLKAELENIKKILLEKQ